MNTMNEFFKIKTTEYYSRTPDPLFTKLINGELDLHEYDDKFDDYSEINYDNYDNYDDLDLDLDLEDDSEKSNEEKEDDFHE